MLPTNPYWRVDSTSLHLLLFQTNWAVVQRRHFLHPALGAFLPDVLLIFVASPPNQLVRLGHSVYVSVRSVE